ncbi:DotU family type IV/VI secretion system protein [Trinickia mobilis]|uniref:DotU family type IV/VI secretion system protein n=1 Tax=Trinickia mobilis TaxID=2816356 RepID=UPI001A8DB006|nr:DotU family type IV/VI secretion system protein [Trinickia mobilis]
MSDYDGGRHDERDERGPLTRAFGAAFEHATTARAAIERRLDEPLDPAAQADELAAQLSAAARRLAREAMAWTGAAGETDIAAAQYAFVVLLDELLLFSEWAGTAAWEARPLEMRVFGTHAGGERLPDAIEALLAQRDPSQRDLANVYLACLMLGFKGRLRGEAGALRHDQLRHALFAFAMQRDAEPARLAAPLERVAVAPGRAAALTQMFPDQARLALLLCVGVGAMLGISHLAFSLATAPVRPAVTQFRSVALLDASPPRVDRSSVSGAVVPLVPLVPQPAAAGVVERTAALPEGARP